VKLHQIGLNNIHCVGSFKVRKNGFYLDADIINFHVLHSGFFSYLAIPSLTESKPGVFTLHDMWSFTGHCAYSYDVIAGKHEMSLPRHLSSCARDNTRRVETKTGFIAAQFNFVTPSTLSKPSRYAQVLAIHHIPYGIDTEPISPLTLNRSLLLGIPTHKKF